MGLGTVATSDLRIVRSEVTEDAITAQLADGRIVSVPLAWSWRLSDATPEQRDKFEIIGTGEGVQWPDIDEDISARGMLEGIPAGQPKRKPLMRVRPILGPAGSVTLLSGSHAATGSCRMLFRELHRSA